MFRYEIERSRNSWPDLLLYAGDFLSFSSVALQRMHRCSCFSFKRDTWIVKPPTSLISMVFVWDKTAICPTDWSPEGMCFSESPDCINQTYMARYQSTVRQAVDLGTIFLSKRGYGQPTDITPAAPVDNASAGCGTRACRLSTKQSRWTCANYFLSSSAQRMNCFVCDK